MSNPKPCVTPSSPTSPSLSCSLSLFFFPDHASVCLCSQLSSLALYLRSPAIVWLSNLDFSIFSLSLSSDLPVSLWKVFLPTPLPSWLHFSLRVHHVLDIMKYTLFPSLCPEPLFSAFCVYLSLATRLHLSSLLSPSILLAPLLSTWGFCPTPDSPSSDPPAVSHPKPPTNGVPAAPNALTCHSLAAHC